MLIRIENKTYGICRVTGKRISKERLKLVPVHYLLRHKTNKHFEKGIPHHFYYIIIRSII